jgi:diguanylate cyclase (GGDEF)-like protein/PAS domain S-box-containing protein
MTERQTSTASDLAPRAPVRPLFGALALCYATAYLAWLSLGGASPALRDLASELVFLPLNVALVVLYLRAARSATLSSGMRRALRLLAMAGGAVLCGNLLSLHGLLTAGRSPIVSVADLCYLADYPLTLGALLSIPVGGRRSDRWKFVCDAGMVLAGGGVAMWYFLVRPTAASAATEPITVALALVYPLADLLLLVGIVTLLLRRPADGNRRAIGWLCAGTVLSVVADLAFNLVRAENGRRGASWADAIYLATYVALVAGAELFWRDPRPAEAPREPVRIGRLVSSLPFVAAGATYALLLVIALRQWVAPLSGVAIGAIAVSLFLGARQLLAFRQSATIAAEMAVRANEARFRSLVQNSSDLIFLLAPDGIIQFASSSASRLIGYEPDALVGVALSALAHPDDAGLVGAFVSTSAQLPGVSPPVEWRLRRPDGHVVQVEAIASNLLADDAVRGVVLNARDVGERKALLDQLAHQAFHDPLTGLANRALFRDRVTHALALARREQRTVTVLYLDLDDFKRVNDTMGHAEGDRLLTMIAARLRACARTTDTVARLGGDEFAVLVEDTAETGSAERLVERILEQMAFPFTLAGTDVKVTTSIGSVVATEGCPDEVLRRADLAMYSAKRNGRGGHRTFEPAMLGG